MINEQELLLANDAPLKKDFYQIYPEILDIVSKITERWDPTTSNESDPGVVLLKLLAFVADKLNYNIDKNILECFMPSATQEESMRKLCDMMGYNMSYYKSAITPVSVTYLGNELTGQPGRDYLTINPFTSIITNEKEDVTYVVVGQEDPLTGKINGKPSTIQHRGESIEILAMEGEYCTCYAGESDLIQIYNLDDNHRFYFPESAVAENGIFVKVGGEETFWDKVDNLNTQRAGQRVYKFGYDSKKMLPYIQFPEDVATLIENGLKINYIRTRGLEGNVKALALSKITTNIYWSDGSTLTDSEKNINVVNLAAANNGENLETLDEAYNNFKKTVGTYDTLVTCRDYANKIYQLISSEGTPYVSNVQVGDIRNDLNRSYQIGTFNSYGTSYVNKSRTSLDASTGKYVNDIAPYDLYLYLFKPITGAYTKDSYKNSFLFSTLNKADIERDLEDYKTIAHNLEVEFNATDDLVAIKNYLTINARLTTDKKLNSSEEKILLTKVKESLYKTFNMRNVDWGEPIVTERIRQAIQDADPSMIKQVDLMEPEIETRFLTANSAGTEYSALDADPSGFENHYVGIVMRNVLAGRVPLFDYFDTFESNFGEQSKQLDQLTTSIVGQKIAKLVTKFSTSSSISSSSPLTLKDNEVIQFSAPSYNAILTYPAYINYHYDGATVKKDNNHLLAAGEALYINYTDSNENVWNLKYYNDGSTGKVNKNGFDETLDHPVIICPTGFDLQDSDARNAVRASQNSTKPKWGWAKTEGFNFGEPQPFEGMYSLGANETIELRAPVEIRFNKTLYCDWIINDPNNNIVNRFTREGTSSKWVFTLETGEYFFYTSSSKTDLGILGSGTRLMFNNVGDRSVLERLFAISTRASSDSKTDPEEVESLGLNASFNWTSINDFSLYPLIIQEREYITLTKDDSVVSLIIDGSNTTLSSTPSLVKKDPTTGVPMASYKFADTPAVDLKTLPGNEQWEVISRLDLNVGPQTTQVLKSSKDSIEFYKWNSAEEKYEENPYGTITGNDSLNESLQVALKSSTLIQRSGGTFLLNPLHEEGEDVEFKIFTRDSAKVFGTSSSLIPSTSGEVLSTRTFENLYTKVACDTNLQLVKLPVFVPGTSEYFGLLMVYYYPVKPTANLVVWTASSSAADNKVSLYSYPEGDATKGAAVDLKYGSNTVKGVLLKRGISILKLDYGCQYLYLDNRSGWKLASDDSSIENDPNSAVTFGIPSLVKITTNPRNSRQTNEGVNIDLLGISYDQISNASKTGLLDEIRKAATISETYHQEGSSTSATITQNIFYYNVPIEGSTHIDINTKAGESLRSSSSWYDYNNVVNKFVISELDADKFDTHIQLTKASKQ